MAYSSRALDKVALPNVRLVAPGLLLATHMNFAILSMGMQ
jgi:hypothetical protein